MPIYEYECKDCSKQAEILVSGPVAKPECPDCGSSRLIKLLSLIGSPVIGSAKNTSPQTKPGDCGRSQCASGGCMFGN